MLNLNLFQDIYRGKKVFVTGHTGFKGAWLTQWLLDLGADVCGYSSYIPSQPSLFEILNISSQITDHRADIMDYQNLKNAMTEFQPDIIFHLAAQPIVSESFRDPRNTFLVNAMGTINIIDCIRNISSVKAGVFITSDKCYENVEWEYGYRENDRLGGKDPYSASKACAEIAFSSYVRSFFQNSPVYLTSTRAGNVIGGGDWAKDRIVPDCMRAWSQKSDVSIRNPYSTRPWQHVLEPLGGYLLLGSELLQKKENLHGESFNFGPAPEVSYSVEKLISLLKVEWKNGFTTSPENFQAMKNMKEAGLLKLCCDKASSRLNWTPSLSFEETANYTSLWYKKYYEGKEDILNFTRKQISDYSFLSAERKKVWSKK